MTSRGSAKIDEKTYFEASLERLVEARDLLVGDHFSGSIYLSGRAAESAMRGLIEAHRRSSREFDISDLKTIKGHNLKELAVTANFSRRLNQSVKEKVDAAISILSVHWRNDYRFRSNRALEMIGLQHNLAITQSGKQVRLADLKNNIMKDWATSIYNNADLIVSEANRIWQSKKV